MTSLRRASDPRYPALIKDLSGLLETARRSSARAVNALMTATYWEIGRRIIEFEQRGATRAEYGAALLEKLSADLTGRFGRGFSRPNLQRFREFYLRFPLKQIRSTVSSELRSRIPPTIRSTASSNSEALIRHRPQGRQVHPRRCRPDAPLPQIRPRALDATRRESARRPGPLLGEERGRRPLRPRRPADQGPRPRVPPCPPRREAPRRRDRADARALEIGRHRETRRP